jgi:hypothetical protein
MIRVCRMFFSKLDLSSCQKIADRCACGKNHFWYVFLNIHFTYTYNMKVRAFMLKTIKIVSISATCYFAYINTYMLVCHTTYIVIKFCFLQ